MCHQNVTGSGFFFIRGTTICITVLIAMMVMAFVPMGLNTASAAVGDVVLVTTGEADSRASNMTTDGRYIAIQSQASVPGIATCGRFQILRTDLTTGDVVLASSTAAGVQGDNKSGHPSITPDARYVAFHSYATNLGGTGANRQIFRKDLSTGAIVLVSSDAASVEGDDESRRPRISADGRYVAFESWATNLGGTGANRQIFVKDLNTGAIVLASSDAASVEGDRETGHPYITPDGRYVSFHSPASNLDPAATGSDTQVFRKDLNTGAIVLVSSDATGVEANDKSKYSFITPDGRYVSFYSEATNLDPAATGVYTQVFRKDLTTGAVVLVSSDLAGVEANDGCGEYGANFMSDDGQYVCFVTEATNLDPAATSGNNDQVFRKDLATGTVVLVSKNSAGVEADSSTWRASMTPDGRYAAFYSEATNLAPAATGLSNQVFRKDITTGDVVLASSTAATIQGNRDSQSSSMTPDGRYVAFESRATNIIPVAGLFQILRKDLTTGEYVLVSSDASGVEGNNDSYDPTITHDARYVSFYSYATNLGPATTPGRTNVFRKDLTSGAIVLVSSDASGVEGNGDSRVYYPSISADGRYVTFRSNATNLVSPATTPGRMNVYRKDLTTGEVNLVSSDTSGTEGNANSYDPSTSSDGLYVSFESDATNLGPAASGANGQVYSKDLTTGEVKLVSSDTSGTEGNAASSNPSTSADGLYVSFRSDATNLGPAATGANSQVYSKDLTTGEVKLASSDASGAEGNGVSESYWSSISTDGRYVSFQSDATNLGPTVSGTHSQAFRKDLSTGAVELASSDVSGVESNDFIRQPSMTPDGRYVAFYSEATNLAPATTGYDDQIFRKELFAEGESATVPTMNEWGMIILVLLMVGMALGAIRWKRRVED